VRCSTFIPRNRWQPKAFPVCFRFIYPRTFLGIWHHNIPSSAFPPFSRLGILRLLPTFQTAMIHPFSFMDHDYHPESVYELLEVKVDRVLIGTWPTSLLLGFSSLIRVLPTATIVEESSETVNYALGLPTTSRGRSSARTTKSKEFTRFVERVLETAETSITDILVALIFMRRARAHLSIETEEWALHRVFLGALILAHKVS